MKKGIKAQEVAISSFSNLLLVLLALTAPAIAQSWTIWEGPKGAPRLRAELWNKADNAEHGIASVEVEVQNVWIHSPAATPQPGIPEAILKYQLDSCPGIFTTDTRLKFAELAPGNHVIRVALVGTDNHVISPDATLTLTTPSRLKATRRAP